MQDIAQYKKAILSQLFPVILLIIVSFLKLNYKHPLLQK